MRRRLPPLNALRALEAAGRHVSFTKAAEELFVTPGAISRQMKLLEDFLGIQLFERTGRDLRISNEGGDYVRALGDVFQQIEHATKRLISSHHDRSLRIHCAMTFTLRWLGPRLPLFHRLHPTRGIMLQTSLVPMRNDLLNMGEVDLVIQQGKGSWPGMVAHRLAGSELIPVCSPTVRDAMGPSPGKKELEAQTFLHSTVKPYYWRCWLAAAGMSEINHERGVHFESSSLAYQAATEGMGVAMGQMALIIDDLESGRLVAPFDLAVDNGEAYYLTYMEHSENDPRQIEFRDWILAQAREFAAAHDFPEAVRYELESEAEL